MAASSPSCFEETWNALEKVKECLKCVTCGRIPHKLYSTSRCEHKYCEGCVERVREHRMCFICDALVKMGDIKIDIFYTEMVPKVQRFVKALSLKEVEL